MLTRAFVAVAIAEALSWAGLLAGMYATYLTEAGDLGVRVFGPLHGGCFVTYVVLTLLMARRHRWSPVPTRRVGQPPLGRLTRWRPTTC